eukprot:CAMPEP_0115062392 /NCGR_PEP_ID=MMETSP0227-20121206/8519_1 /TAXON_ID=89957 /ORGANISM="Polarella glacialis, Strain CCMP 1383" /LENGTH=112 /DNA_ID=CAMNT_0002447763 /DNA_START=184 /DNA_END=523 /DNA_ORIENTATION=+
MTSDATHKVLMAGLGRAHKGVVPVVVTRAVPLSNVDATGADQELLRLVLLLFQRAHGQKRRSSLEGHATLDVITACPCGGTGRTAAMASAVILATTLAAAAAGGQAAAAGAT